MHWIFQKESTLYGNVYYEKEEGRPYSFAQLAGVVEEGKNDPQKYKKVIKFHVLKCWMFSFEAERFSYSLDFLYGGRGIG
jgi:hypothetical protein